MQLHTQDHIELMAMFERVFKGQFRLDREDKALWSKGSIYQHGEANAAFLAFRHGVAYGVAISRQSAA